LAGAEQLAALYQFRLEASNPDERRRRTAQAEQVLDDLLAHAREAAKAAEGGDPEALEEAVQRLAGAHLVRFRHWATRAAAAPAPSERGRLAALAADELARALEVRPDDVDVLLSATEYAVQSGDVSRARAYFDRLPEDVREGLRGQLARGLIDLAR